MSAVGAVDAVGAGKEGRLCYNVIGPFPQGSSWEMGRYTLRPVAWPCRDVDGHLRGERSTLQAGSILPGLTQPLIPPALCLHCQHPHLFQLDIRPDSSLHTGTTINSVSQEVNSDLEEPVSMGLKLVDFTIQITCQSPFRIQLKFHSFLQEASLTSSVFRHLGSPHSFQVL